MVDYSKWDRLELSDDSDIEVHPNVDKRSFIRAKQRLIHEERQKRKIEIEQLKLDRQVNEQLLKRIQQFRDEVTKHDSSVNSPDELILQLLVKNASNPAENKPAYTPPHSHGKQPPSYSQMMASLVDQIKKDVDQQKPDDRWKAFIDEFQVHFNKVTKLQKEVAEQLNKLEKEERAKITSESYHDGFSQGYVNKESEASTSSPPKKKTIATQKVAAVEQINPNADPSKALHRNDSLSSGAEADVEEVADEDDGQDASIKPSALGYEFSKIPINDYMKLAGFISRNPKVVAEREENGLLVEAFNSQIAGKEAYAKKCVHHALLLQYCRQLGANGVGIFFKRITTNGHQARNVFRKDVDETYHKLCTRAKELAEERSKDSGNVEQIQLQAVDPGTSINIVVPPKDSEDPQDQRSRQIFESFPPGLQRALNSGSLDEVNKVLAKMSVEEAEEVVEKLGEGGMLSLEAGIIDTTTEEGQAKVEEIERNARLAAERKGKGKPMEDTIMEGVEEEEVLADNGGK